MRTDAILGRWTLTAVVAAGLFTLVGSGGGLPGFPPIDWGSIGPLPQALLTPTRLVVQAGTPARFTVQTFSVSSPTYSWCLTPANSGTCEAVAGATGDTLTLTSPTLADDGATVQVRVDDPNGVAFAFARLFVSGSAPIDWSDGDFAADTWTVRITAEPAAGGPSASVATVALDGNPGAWRQTVVQISGGASSLRIEQLRAGWVHDPATQGAIRFIDAREDCQTPGTSTTDAYIGTVPMLEQGGRRYVGRTHWQLGCSPEPTWIPLTPRVGMTAADFTLVDGPTCGTGEPCPDFGAGGAPIQFGFAQLVDTSAAVSAGTRTRGIDNWRLTIWRQ
jgi:hypothetical protein